jgi:signal transduction histidine kinase
LANQQALERERLRIAQDIHDDLGARVTQISLVSAMAERTVAEPEASRAGFQSITQMSRELVSALYDTIWVVNPENDNLEAVGHYICQMANQLSSQAGLPALPADAPISSHQRHNLTMAVKEALHNIIKHAHAKEVQMKIVLDDSEASVVVQDDGRGFDLGSVESGSGLGNLKHRLETVGGSAEVFSSKGCGTVVHLRMPLKRGETSSSARAHGRAKPRPAPKRADPQPKA